MAKSSKTTPRKKRSTAKSKDKIVDAEVVGEAVSSEVTEAASTSKADLVETAADVIGETEADHEPMDYEVDDSTVASKTDHDASENDDSVPDTAAETEEPVSDPSAAREEAAPAVTAELSASGGLFPSILGGVIAGALGFGAALLIFPDGWRQKDDSLVTSLQSGLMEQKDNLSSLTEQVGALGGRLDSTVDELRSEIGEKTESAAAAVGALGVRLDRLSEGDGTVALPEDVQVLLNAQKEKIAALSEEVAGMAAAAKAQMQAAADQQETAEQAEARVKARSAMQDIRLALVSGEPFADALADVAPATDIPEGLQAVASEGVPTQTEILQSYPAAARAALSKAVREEAGDDTQSRIALFFKDQLSARSLTPREGDDADAILSRAEAAVRSEDLATAISEIEALPESAKAEFSNWQASASARLAAVDGFDAVSAALNGN